MHELPMSQLFIHPLSDVQSSAIGSGTRVWQFVVVLSGAQIGQDCNICSHCLIENDVVIGDRVTVKSGVQLWDGLRVGNDVFIGPNASFTNDRFPRSQQKPEKFLVTTIHDGASIGGGGGHTAWHHDWRAGHGRRGCRRNPFCSSRIHCSWQPRADCRERRGSR